MGLDQYVAVMRPHEVGDRQTDEECLGFFIFQWREHLDLHDWMEQLYRRKGGKAELFRQQNVRLDLPDIDALERVVKDDALPAPVGFEDLYSKLRAQDELFIALAREAIAKGWVLFYDSW